MTSPVVNALTIDVEDYYMVSAFESIVSKEQWNQHESRVVNSTQLVLDIMEQNQTKATFFVVGWVAEQYPDLIKKIHQAGHEIACHSYFHRLVYDMTPDEFRRDLEKNKKNLEELIQSPVLGYRAPSFSITEKSKWAIDIMAELGLKYDASVLPAAHARGGWIHEGGKKTPYRLGPLAEFPMSTTTILGKELPFSGGGYFRLFPYSWTKKSFMKANAQGHPVINYLHPWEFDPGQPRMPIKGFNRFRHYVNVSKTEKKFRQLLNDFNFGRVQDILEDMKLL